MENETVTDLKGVVEQFQAPLIRYAARMLRDPETAKDVVQESFIKYLRVSQKKESGEIENVQAWLYRITRNGCLDRIKSGRAAYEVRMSEEFEHGDPAPGPDHQLERDEIMKIVRKKISQLPDKEREIVVLKMEHGKSYKDIAEIMELSVTNVGFILHTAMKKLSAELKGLNV